VLLVTVCYIALNAAYFHVLSPGAIAGSTRVAADAADAVLGRGGAAFMSTPARAIVLQAVWASFLVATGTYRVLFTRVVYTEWIFFALMAVGLLRLRSRADYTPRYRVWGYPVVPVVFIIASLYIVANQVVKTPKESLVGLLLVGIGWPVYRFVVRSDSRIPSTESP
jgi:APA family basic amino acid/polyamine antiporter